MLSESRRRMVPLAVVTVVLAGCGVLLAGCGDDTQRPVVPPASATAGPAVSSGPPPYTIASTRPASADGGASTTLVIRGGSTVDAQAAITDYLQRTPPQGYLFVEAVSRAGDTEWICAGERLATEDDLRYAIFEGTQAIEDFPGQWIECRD